MPPCDPRGGVTSQHRLCAAQQVILSFSDIMPNRSYSLAKGASGRSFEQQSVWRRTSTSSVRMRESLGDLWPQKWQERKRG